MVRAVGHADFAAVQLLLSRSDGLGGLAIVGLGAGDAVIRSGIVRPHQPGHGAGRGFGLESVLWPRGRHG